MSWAPIRRLVPQQGKRPLVGQVATALAIEAGMRYVVAKNPALGVRVKLASIRNGVVHALATSAPAAHELRAMREGLFEAMRAAASVPLTDLRTEIRGTLDPAP